MVVYCVWINAEVKHVLPACSARFFTSIENSASSQRWGLTRERDERDELPQIGDERGWRV